MKFQKLLAFSTAFIGVVLSTGCGSKNNDDGGTINPDASIKIRLVYENKGYGDSWVKAIARGYESKNKDVAITVVSKAAMNFENDFSIGDRNTTDLYVCCNPGYQTFIANGSSQVKGYDTYFVELTDLYNSPNPYDNNSTSIKSKLEDNDLLRYCGYHYNNTSQVKYYMVPYAGGASGFLYNSSLISDPSIINTTDKLVSYINNWTTRGGNNLAAIMWSAEGISYMEYVMDTWIAQYAGVDGYDAICNLCEKDSWGDWDWGTHDNPAILESYKVAQKIIQSPTGTYNASTFNEANSDFKNGYADLMPNGNWFASELIKRAGAEGFDVSNTPIRYLKTPIISSIIEVLPDKSIKDDNKLSEVVKAIDANQNSVEGVSENDFNYIKEARKITSCNGFNQHCYIPSTSKNIETSKDILLYFASKEGSKIFAENTYSANAFTTERIEGASDFVKSIEDASLNDAKFIYLNTFNSKFTAGRVIARYNSPTIYDAASALTMKASGKYIYDAQKIYDLCLQATRAAVERPY